MAEQQRQASGGWLNFLGSYPADRPVGDRPVHFVGIAGSGQNPLARLVVDSGHAVTGSDLKGLDESTRELVRRGGRVFVGHRAEQVEGAGLLVISSAVQPDNPEVVRAAELGIPVVKRSEFIGELTRHRQAVCIAGTHGKTTTSAMVGLCLLESGLDPTLLVGGSVPALGTGGRYGRGPHLVVEADEFDGTFLRFRPWLALLTNVEPDHLDYYGTFENVVGAFRKFLGNVPADGHIVACADDPTTRQIVGELGRPAVTYALDADADWHAAEIERNDIGGHDFTAYRNGERFGRFALGVPGRHNVLNALGAVAAADLCGASAEAIGRALERFAGVKRRFDLKGTVRGIKVYDDYAHHPTEIVMALRIARERHDGRVVAVHQPFTIHRTRVLFDEFARAFGDADKVYITDIMIPPGREPNVVVDITSADLVRAMRHPDAIASGTLEQTVERLLKDLRPGDLVMTMGCGNVNWVADQLVARLGQH